MKSLSVILAGSFAAAILSGCIASLVYSGDGHLRDHGWFEGLNRYVIDIGSVDLRNENSYSFHLRDLPQVQLIVGFDITFETIQLDLVRQTPITAVVAMELRGPDGTVILNEKSPLNTWGWGERSDEPNIRFLWRSPSTTFTPSSRGEYTLRVSVIEPDHDSLRYQSHVAAKGGGWDQ